MVEIIAECGKNQINKETGLSVADCLENAKKLALATKNAGASVCKWQCHVFEDEQRKRSDIRYEWIRRNENLTPYDKFWLPLKQYHDEIKLPILITPMSKMAAEKINFIVDSWKIGSGDITDLELIEYVARSGKPIILSSGMSLLKELDRTVSLIRQFNTNLTILHCVSSYPCPEDKVNLNVMKEYEWRYQTKDIGYSDHALSLTIPAIAVAMGAQVIEKHFTFDRTAFGPDHKVSLLPEEFKKMVENIHWVEMIMGSKNKKLTEEEVRFRKIFRKV